MPFKILIYNVVMSLILVIMLPFICLAALFSRKIRTGLFNRFGFIPVAFKEKVAGRDNIWLHAASAGEVKCILPLAEELKVKYPGANIVFTATGINGRRMLESTSKNTPVCYLPFDLYLLIKPIVKLIKPRILVIAETEYWPNLFCLAKKVGAKIGVVNGRFSSKAVKRYRFVKPLLELVLSYADVFAMRNSEDANILLTFKVPGEKIIVTGDLKYEIPRVDLSGKTALSEALIPALKEKVILCGSVHLKEAEILLSAFKIIKNGRQGITAVIAPRFLEEIPGFVKIIESYGYKYCRRSAPVKEKTDIVLLDTIGELTYAYGLCTVAFVGGSLVDGIGGHNLLEPLYLGKPVLFGPFAFNFREIEKELKTTGTGFIVKNPQELSEKVNELFSDSKMLGEIVETAKEILNKRKGGLLRTLELL